MLEMNLETSINNLNYLRYMEDSDNENEALKSNLKSKRVRQTEEQERKE